MPLEPFDAPPGADTAPEAGSPGDVSRAHGAPFAGWDLVHRDWTVRQREPVDPAVWLRGAVRWITRRFVAVLPFARPRVELVSPAAAGPAGTAQSSAPPTSSR